MFSPDQPSLVCSLPMAIGADEIALGYLLFEDLHAASIGGEPGDVSSFERTITMIKIKNPRAVDNPTIVAWLVGLVLPEKIDHKSLPRSGPLSYGLWVGGIVSLMPLAYGFFISLVPFTLFLVSCLFVFLIALPGSDVIFNSLTRLAPEIGDSIL